MKPKKILHVASRNEYRFGSRCYGLPYKINNGFIRNGHNVVWFSDRDMAKTSSVIPARSFGRRACNRKFIEFSKNFNPDIIAICSPTLIDSATLMQVRKELPGVILFQYNIDGLYIDSNVEKIVEKSSVVDWTFSTTAGPILENIATDSSPASFIPNPVDSSIDRYKNHLEGQFVNDVLFICGIAHWDDPDDIRVLTVNNIENDMNDVNVEISYSTVGDKYLQAYRNSKMALSFNHRPPGTKAGIGGPLYMCSSDRISFCMGNGLLTFVNKMFSLSDLYSDECLVEVSGYEELKDKIRYFNANDAERRIIAKKAHEISHSEFNCELVTRYMIESVLGVGFSRDYHWPTEHYCSVSSQED